MKTIEPISEDLKKVVTPSSERSNTSPSSIKPVNPPVSNDILAQSKIIKISNKRQMTKTKKITISLVAFLLVGLGSFLLLKWYENPQHMVSDAVITSLAHKTATYNYSLTEQGKSGNIAGSIKTLNYNKIALSAAYKNGSHSPWNLDLIGNDSGDYYLKIKFANPEVSFKTSSESSNGSFSFNMSTSFSDINDKWIKISTSDINSLSSDNAKDITCTKKALGNTSSILDLVKNYYASPAIVAKGYVGMKSGNVGYKVKFSEDNYKAFIKQIKQTNFYEEFHKCNNNSTLGSDQTETLGDEKQTSGFDATVWTNAINHQLTKIDAKSMDSTTPVTVAITPDFNSNIEIKTPSSSISMKDAGMEILSAILVISLQTTSL